MTLPGFYDAVRGSVPAGAGVAGGPAVRRGRLPGHGRRRRLPRGRGRLHAARADRRPAHGRGGRPARRLWRARASRPSCRPPPASRWRSGWCPTSGPTPSSRPSGPGWPASYLPGSTVTVTPEGAVAPALTPVDHPAMQRSGPGHRDGCGGRPPLYTREGGSGPEEALGRVLDAPVLFLGVGLPGDRIHAPNERMVMDQFWKGLVAAGELLLELGGVEVRGDASTGRPGRPERRRCHRAAIRILRCRRGGRPRRAGGDGRRCSAGVPGRAAGRPRVGELRGSGGEPGRGSSTSPSCCRAGSASSDAAARAC